MAQAGVACTAGGQPLHVLKLAFVEGLRSHAAQKGGRVHCRHTLSDRDDALIWTQLVKLSLEHVSLGRFAGDFLLQE